MSNTTTIQVKAAHALTVTIALANMTHMSADIATIKDLLRELVAEMREANGKPPLKEIL